MVEAQPLLRGPHGFAELTLPEGPPITRRFFETCTESRDFQCAASEREQVHLVHRWACENHPEKLSLQQIADFFQLAKSTVAHHLRKPVDSGVARSPCRNGRPSLLTEEQLTALRRFIEERFASRYPVSYEDCRAFLLESFDLAVNIKSLRSLIERTDAFKTVVGEPMEDSRNFCDPSAIDEYLAHLEEVLRVGKVPAAFVVNIDEAGFSEFVDARRSMRIVPADYPMKKIPVPVTRAEKRATLLAGICADGSTLKPLVIVPRDTMETELLLRGYTTDKIMFGHSDKGYMTTSLFTNWAKRCFIPEMKQKRVEHQYDGPIILTLDRFGCHCNDEFVSMCEEENIVCVFLPPHTSDQLQPCDLGVFAIQKNWMSNIRIPGNLNRQTKQIVKIIDSYRMATSFKNVTGAFRRAGIVTFLDEQLRLMARVDVRFASAVRHLQLDDDNGYELPGDKKRINI